MLAFSTLGVIGTSLHAKAKHVKSVTKQEGSLQIPYEEYRLDNGLTVLLHKDDSAPIVHVDITYHVGSAREELHKSGFAHFFEHMMFQGSENVGDEMHFKIITEAGGTLNGTTNRDRTNYFQTVPANQLEKMLWLESDRMGFFLDAVTEEKFEVQRATVINERGQRYDNRPYGLVMEETAKNLYPYGHPYSWLTIGYIEDINRVELKDLKNFFLRWYGPNNATLSIGGDIDIKETLAWIEKYFGSIPKGPEVVPMNLPKPVLTENRYVTMHDNYANLPMLRMVFPVDKMYGNDVPALDALADIIGSGVNSILYKNLVKTGEAVSASVYNYTTELAGEFWVTVLPYPGKSLADMEKLVRASFKEFEERGVTDEDLARFKGSFESNMVFGLESVSRRVSTLASYQTFAKDAAYMGEDLKGYLNLNKQQIMDAYNKYIKNKPAVILSVTTKGNENNIVAAPNYEIDKSKSMAISYDFSGLTNKKGTDNFDRSVMPDAGKPVVITAPKVWKAKKDHNVEVIGTYSDKIPVVNLYMSFPGGKLMDPKGKEGLSYLFAQMMTEDTRYHTAEEMSDALQQLGSSISISTSKDAINVFVRSLEKNLDQTLELLEEHLLSPEFNQDDFDRNKNRLLESLANNRNEPSAVASTAFNYLLYGSDNTFGTPSSGTETSIANINLADIQHYYNQNFSLKNAKIVVVGEIDEKSILPKIDFLNKMKTHEVALPTWKGGTKAAPKVYFIDIPGAAQTEFRIGHVNNVKYDALGDYYKSNIMNFPLGGAFNSRLNLYLREEKGWTYGARSFFSSDNHTGTYQFSAGIKREATADALSDVLRILEEYKAEGMDAEELSFTKNSMTLSEARKYEVGVQKAGFLNTILKYELPVDYTSKQNKILENMKLNEAQALAKSKIPNTDQVVILLVGDKETVWDSLVEKGFDIEEVQLDEL